MYNLVMNGKKLGDYIKSLRLSKGLSRDALGSFANVTGGHINNIERGDRIPSPEVMIALANALETTSAKLITILEDAPTYSQEKVLVLPGNISDSDYKLINLLASRLVGEYRLVDDLEERLKVTREEVIADGLRTQDRLAEIRKKKQPTIDDSDNNEQNAS